MRWRDVERDDESVKSVVNEERQVDRKHIESPSLELHDVAW